MEFFSEAVSQPASGDKLHGQPDQRCAVHREIPHASATVALVARTVTATPTGRIAMFMALCHVDMLSRHKRKAMIGGKTKAKVA
mmetsp:Transcript_31157/g.72595  ORF Transcript_31157/g.72595 Transcript_31157/m.72595 type:complete len:84 (-) Transcript_31157:1513-1764(-)